jgi:hypothetical protein
LGRNGIEIIQLLVKKGRLVLLDALLSSGEKRGKNKKIYK